MADAGDLSAAASTGRSQRSRVAQILMWVALIAAVVVAPFFLYPVFVMQILCFALFACAFNLLIGFTGLLSFGHAAFFGGAAYVAGHVIKVWGLSPLAGILVGALAAAVLGYLIGALAIRRQGIYFAMITLALAQIVYFFALQLPFTGGENGLQGIPRGHLFGIIDLSQPMAMYCFVAAIFLIGFLIIYRTVHSPFGQVLQAIRENEPRALSLGYNIDRFKLMAFVLSATLSGVAGGTKAVVFQFASLTDVHWQTSGEVILMTLLGGMGTIFGPAVGAVTIVTLQHELSFMGSWVQVVIGAIFILCVLLFRRGIVGEIGRMLRVTSV
ncbi:branched-chain amino acid ABC transporter permease [Amorphus sp. 3PC139-8]